MPTPRFTVVSPPIEQQLASSAALGWRRAFAFGKEHAARVNVTTVTSTVLPEPGSIAFVLALLATALIIVRHLVIRVETKRILKEHQFGAVEKAGPSGTKTHHE